MKGSVLDVYRRGMRFIPLALLFVIKGVHARPGWHPLEFSFVLSTDKLRTRIAARKKK